VFVNVSVRAVTDVHELLDEVKDHLFQIGARGMTVSDVRGFGRTGGRRQVYRGSASAVDFVPKVRIQIVADDEMVHPIVDAILATSRTGKIGDAQLMNQRMMKTAVARPPATIEANQTFRLSMSAPMAESPIET
jgi:nitrogen regulatory protein P-II 1